MERKRKNSSSIIEALFSSKHSRAPANYYGSDEELHIPANPQSRVNSTYGQRSAFPGLDENVDENALFYGPASNGLEYLNMVRSEAKGVPNLLVAPLSPSVVATNEHSNHERGYYADGAYTALPDATIESSSKEDEDGLQEEYYVSLCNRFSNLSATLQDPPRATTTSTESAAEPPLSFNPSSRTQWRRCILNTQPRMMLLNRFSQADVVTGLAALETVLTSGNLQRRKNMGAWAWGLLAKCREVGQMDSDEVAVLRDLGKKARGIVRGIMAGTEEGIWLEEGEIQEDSDNGGTAPRGRLGRNGVVSSNMENSPPSGREPLGHVENTQFQDHKSTINSSESLDLSTLSSRSSDPLSTEVQRLLDSLDQFSPPASKSKSSATQSASHPRSEPQQQQGEVDNAEHEADQQHTVNGERGLRIDATLDMIITIVGEFYGQRDLLDGRLLWGEMPHGGIMSRNGT